MGNLRQVEGRDDEALGYYKKAVERLDKDNPDQFFAYHKALHEYYDLAVKKSGLVSNAMLQQICQDVSEKIPEFRENDRLLSFMPAFIRLNLYCVLAIGSPKEIKAVNLPPLAEIVKKTSNQNKLQAMLDLSLIHI